MKVMPRFFLLLLCGFWIAGCASVTNVPQVSSGTGPNNVLFVGNSFTYYNDSLHNHLRRLMRSNGREPGLVRIMTISGAHLAEHEPALPALLASADWNAVVLQGHSREPVDERAGFEQAARRLHKLIDHSGAKTVLFMTWAYRDEPQMTKPLANTYTSLGNELGALVVPVGLAFAAATKQYPEIELLHDDLRHPTLAGSYLAACVFYAAFFNESPSGSSYTAGLDPRQASALQAIAWATTQAYYAHATQ